MELKTDSDKIMEAPYDPISYAPLVFQWLELFTGIAHCTQRDVFWWDVIPNA
jgi:hypothetical protein